MNVPKMNNNVVVIFYLSFLFFRFKTYFNLKAEYSKLDFIIMKLKRFKEEEIEFSLVNRIGI